MNTKAQIYNLIIIDESGSMLPLRQSTLSGVNETIAVIRKAQQDFADTQEQYLTLVTFDSSRDHQQDVRTIIPCRPINEVADFTDYSPCGCTPLYDAMGMSITELQRHIEGNPDASAVVTVITDGLENASREWSARRLKALIEKLKEEGWTFSYMGSEHNVEDVTQLLSIDHAVEFSHDVVGSANTWKRERSSKLGFFARMARGYDSKMSVDQKRKFRRTLSTGYYSDRVTPSVVTQLEPGEVFVFGSNIQGLHDGGAAAYAFGNFGAVWGQAEGLQGQSYAIPTDGLACIQEAVERFTRFAGEHPEMRFLVVEVGCGRAGFTPGQVAPLFMDCVQLDNVSLPDSFWRVLGLRFVK